VKIERLDAYRVTLPLVYPFRTAYGNDDAIETVLLRLSSGGIEGWGEATAWHRPGYSCEFAEGVMLVIERFLAPMVVGEEIGSGEELAGRLRGVKDNRFAKAAIDMAWWDLYAKQLGKPLWRMIGGTRQTVEVGADFGVMDSVDELLKTIGGAVEQGFKRVKLKFRPGWDIDMVRQVRKAFPGLVFHVDCNSAYTLADAKVFEQLDPLGLAMLEQPLAHDDLIDHATLQRRIRTPICLDESITSFERARKAIETGACQWINIKAPRVGGMTEAIRIHDLCKRADMPCWIGGMLESAVGARHCLALATLDNICYPSDIFPSTRFFKTDVCTPDVVLDGPGVIHAPEVPGVGAEPEAERLAAQTVSAFHVSS